MLEPSSRMTKIPPAQMHQYDTTYGIEEITSNIERVDVSEVFQLFGHIHLEDIERPPGKIDLLLVHPSCQGASAELLTIQPIPGLTERTMFYDDPNYQRATSIPCRQQ